MYLTVRPPTMLPTAYLTEAAYVCDFTFVAIPALILFSCSRNGTLASQAAASASAASAAAASPTRLV